MKNFYAFFGFIFVFVLSVAVQADTMDETIVYITCKTADGIESQGSGVLISPDGKVLTAKHVIPTKNGESEAGTVCNGAIGSAFSSTRRMIIGKKSSHYDAAILKFSPIGGEKFNCLKYCKLSDSMRRKKIFATGFPDKTGSGVPSSRIGVLSTILPDQKGFIETDSATARGMSGGMVTLENSSSLIGIIAGAEFDPGTGTPKYFAVLAAQEIADELGLTEESVSCIKEFGPDKKWQSGDPPLKLGINKEEGYCFLTGVWGIFNNIDDKVWIETDEKGEFVLTGIKQGGGKNGAFARCVWY